MRRTTGVDIIIPVYNALEDLKLCLESIRRHTDLELDRVVLIDDRSPDQNVYPYMKSVEQPGIVVLQNEQNQGFSGTINKGLEFSDRDVILLNSDTIVTANWIDKIVACAYSDAAIGTVTPFSNNATLCSIPNFCEENTIPYGLSIDEYAQVIERCSMRKYPTITVAVGFCMFIKREVVERVGLFDQETFRKGYGEENDFCWRAEQLGYHHVLCDDTYIYHSGSSSFLSDEKKKLLAEHDAIIRQRYPKQHQKNAEYVRDNPHQYLRSNVDIHAKLKNGKRNILYVLHLDFRADATNNVGGTQFHVKDLVDGLREDNNLFVLAREGDMLRLTAYLEQEQMAFAFYIGQQQFQSFHCKEIARVLRQILAAFSIDLVHVHHMIGLSFDVFTVAKEMGIALAATMHDFYYICPTIKLLENGECYCNAQGKDCVECLNRETGYAKQIDFLPVWREKCRQMLGLCDVLIVPSDAEKTLYCGVYPELEEKIRVIPHGLDTFEEDITSFRKPSSHGFSYTVEHALEGNDTISGWVIQENKDCRYNEVFVCLEDTEGKFFAYRAMADSRPDVSGSRSDDRYLYSGFHVQIPDSYFSSGTLKMQLIIRNNGEEFCGDVETISGYQKREKKRRRIAFLGGLNKAKGSQTAYELITQGGSQYDWYIVGGIGDPNLLTLDKDNVFKTGWYKRENAASILRQNQIDLVCILPIWPETFCYTLSEAQLAGIPVLATDIGAMGERMRRDQTGWLVSPDASARDVLKTIDAIFADQAGFEQICDNAAAFRHRSTREMCEDYAGLYQDFACAQKHQAQFDAQAIYNAYFLCQAEHTGLALTADMDLVRRVNELEATVQTINQSLEYRMVKFFNRENVPFKRLIKWLIGFAYRVYVKFFRK